jgi:hypothetical protein
MTALLWAKGADNGKAFDYRLSLSDVYLAPRKPKKRNGQALVAPAHCRGLEVSLETNYVSKRVQKSSFNPN